MKNKIPWLRSLLIDEMTTAALTGGKRGRNQVKKNVYKLLGAIEAIMKEMDPILMREIYERRLEDFNKKDSQVKASRPWIN